MSPSVTTTKRCSSDQSLQRQTSTHIFLSNNRINANHSLPDVKIAEVHERHTESEKEQKRRNSFFFWWNGKINNATFCCKSQCCWGVPVRCISTRTHLIRFMNGCRNFSSLGISPKREDTGLFLHCLSGRLPLGGGKFLHCHIWTVSPDLCQQVWHWPGIPSEISSLLIDEAGRDRTRCFDFSLDSSWESKSFFFVTSGHSVRSCLVTIRTAWCGMLIKVWQHQKEEWGVIA